MKEKNKAREERNKERLTHGDWVMAEFYAHWQPENKKMHPVIEEFKKLMEGTLEKSEPLALTISMKGLWSRLL